MNERKTRVLVLGSTGMLGSAIFRVLHADPAMEVFGTMREPSGVMYFAPELRSSLIPNIQVESEAGILTAFSTCKPDIVINCIGIIKQLPSSKDYIECLSINSTLPHRLAKFCSIVGARFVHFSTDCVFSGAKGQYREDDYPDADDLYGRTKLLGEVSCENAVTLRTSIIGHELASSRSLLEWFLSQYGEVKGFRKAVFSGIPTIEIARILKTFVIPNNRLSGLYHLSVEPINKFELLSLVAQVYSKDIRIIAEESFVIDRSLNSDRFQMATGFKPKKWRELITEMHSDQTLRYKR